MARKRIIKPEFWSDSKTGNLSDKATKLFIGLLNFSDDCGVMKFDPLQIKAQIFPYSKNDVISDVILPILYELLPSALLVLLEYDKSIYLFIKNFDRHQTIDRPSNPTISSFSKDTTPKQLITKDWMDSICLFLRDYCENNNVNFDEISVKLSQALVEDSASTLVKLINKLINKLNNTRDKDFSGNFLGENSLKISEENTDQNKTGTHVTDPPIINPKTGLAIDQKTGKDIISGYDAMGRPLKRLA